MKVRELKKHLANKICPIYFVVGDDNFLKNFALKQLQGILNQEMMDFNFNTFEVPFDFNNLLRATKTLPLMDEYKIVYLKPINKITDINEECFKNYIKNPEMSTIFIVNDNKSLLKKYYKSGEVIDCNKLNINECITQADSWFLKKDIKTQNGVSRKICEYCMLDLQKIHNEIDKLSNYKPNEVINLKDVEDCVAVETDFKIYEFSQSLANRNAESAYNIMNSLVKSGNQPSALLSAIIKQYRRIFYASISKDSDEEIAKSLNVKTFAIKMARMTARKYSQMELKNYLDKLMDLEYKFFTGKVRKNDVLGLAMCILIA